MDGTDKNSCLRATRRRRTFPARFFFRHGITTRRLDQLGATGVPPTEWLSNHLFDRLLGDATYRRKFAARWKQLREKEFSGPNLRRMIEDNVRTLGDAAQRNALRWRTLTGPYPDRLTFEQDVAQMQEWTAARLNWLEAEIGRHGL
jgi:hypothetical protein